MIEMQNIEKHYFIGNKKKVIVKGLDVKFQKGVAVGIFGRNGAGKSTILRMISGIEDPNTGVIIKRGTISWPVGFAGSFHPELSAAQNIRFVARIYGVDTNELIEFVKEFSELGPHFTAPIKTYSSGMRARLAFGVSMGIHFDTYLIDEVTAVGDASFRERSNQMLRERIGDSGAVIVSHSMPQMRNLCDHGLVLVNGFSKMYYDIEEAIEVHQGAMKGKIPDWAANYV